MAEGRAGRWFENVANALLERAVPRVREWLQGQFGPGADVSGIRLEGRDVHVDDTRVPLGPRAKLSIARASFRVTGEVARPLVLHALTGELRVDEGGFIAKVRFESARTVRSEAWIEGAFIVERASWPRVDGQGEQAPLAGSLDVMVTSTKWTLGGTLTAADAKLALEADGDLDESGAKRLGRAKLEIKQARAGHFADAAAAITGAKMGGTLTMLADAAVDGLLTWTDTAGLVAELTAATERSRMRGRATGALDETLAGTVDGVVAIADVYPTKLTDTAMVDGKLAGTARAPTLAGIARVRDIDLDFSTSREGVVVRFDEAPPSLVELALGLAAVETTLRVPPTARLTGEVTTKKAEIAIETDTSALLAVLALDATITGTIRGRLSCADARAWFPASVRPRPTGVMNVRAAIDGPALSADVDAKSLELEVMETVTFPFRDATARVFIDRDRIVLRSFVGRLHDGEVTGEGLVSSGFTFHIRCGGVRVEQQQPWLHGALAGTLQLERRGQGPVTGHGELRVDGPIFPAIVHLTPTLGRYGISTPSPVGVAPLFTRYSFGERGVRFEGIDARLDGAAARGFVTIDWTKVLAGTLNVDVSERLVRNSALLGIPAMLTSNFALVVELSGSISEPRARVDPLKSLGVADAVQTVTSAFGDLFAPFAAPKRADPALDAILDRILDRDPRSEHLIADLVDRGIDPEEFEELLARRRAARRS